MGGGGRKRRFEVVFPKLIDRKTRLVCFLCQKCKNSIWVSRRSAAVKTVFRNYLSPIIRVSTKNGCKKSIQNSF